MANKYIQQYNTQADYDSGTHSYPNVSLITSTNNVLYTTLEEGWDKIMSGATIGVMYEDGTVWTGNVTTITSSTIPNKGSAVEVRMTSGVTNIGDFAFSGCTSLTSLTIGDSVTSIGRSAFQRCSGLTSIVIPSGVTNIGQSAFEYCNSLTSVTIPNSVTSIENRAFCNVDNLKRVNSNVDGECILPNNLTTIGGQGFVIKPFITSLTIPSTVTSIGALAFASYSSLETIVSLATTAPTIESNTFFQTKTGGTLYVPQGSTGYDVWMSYLPNGWTVQDYQGN